MKWLLRAVCALTLCLLALVLTIRFAPQTLLYALNEFSNYTVKADKLDLRYFPPTVRFENLLVNSNKTTFAEVQSLNAVSDWDTLINKSSPLAQIEITQGKIDLSKLPVASTQAENKRSTAALNLFSLANIVRLKAEDFVIFIDQDSSLKFNTLNSSLIQANRLELASKAEYHANGASILLDTITQLEDSANSNQIVVKLAQLDLANFLESDESKEIKEDVDQGQTVAPQDELSEAALDWAWMDTLGPSTVSLEVGELNLADGKIESLAANIELSEKIEFAGTGRIRMPINDEQAFDETMAIDLVLTPIADNTIGVDAEGSIALRSEKFNILSSGSFNLNNLLDNQLNIDLDVTELPIAFQIDDDLIGQYLPLNAKAQVSIDESILAVSELNSVLANSDLAGKFLINFESLEKLKIQFDLKSKEFNYRPPSPTNTEAKTSDNSALFSKQALDWTWMSAIDLTGSLNVETLNYGETRFEKLSTPLELNPQGLSMQNLAGELNGGAFELDLQLSPVDQNVITSTALVFNDIDVSQLGLFDEGEITGGLSSGNLRFETQGASIYDFASKLNGQLIINIAEGKIKQGGLDTLGSDLILSTLSKLNPFSKSDSSTTLECAVLNLKVEDGIIRAKNSIAVETSKIAIVGTGKIDLNKESLDLKFNPKPKKSLGINISSLAKAVKMGGTLSKPSPEVSALGVAEAGLSIGAAISTGGLSLLAEGLIDDVTADQACKNAKTAFDSQQDEKPSTETIQAELEPVEVSPGNIINKVSE